MEDYVYDNGFSVVEDMCGHGIGQNLHEPPQVPNYFSDDPEDDFDLQTGRGVGGRTDGKRRDQ